MDLLHGILTGSIVFHTDTVLQNATWYQKWDQQNICSSCLNPADTLLRCSRCHGVLYCGIDCQTTGLQDHKKICKQIGRGLKSLGGAEKNENLIKFLQFDEALYEKDGVSELVIELADAYMDTCFWITENYHKMGLTNHSKTALQLARHYSVKTMKAYCFKEHLLLNFSEVERRSDTTIEDIDWKIPLNFIVLGEVQEAFVFVIHWISFFGCREDEAVTPFKHFLKWEQKQCFEQNLSDFYNIPEDLFNEKPVMLTVYFSLVLIKARILNMIEEHIEKREIFTAFMMGTHWRLGENSPVIQIKQMIPVIHLIAEYVGVEKPTFLKGKTAKNVLENNYHQVESYMKSIHQINVHGLFSLTHEESLMNPDFKDNEEVMGAGTFVRPLFQGLENKEKILRLAQKIVIGNAKTSEQKK